MKRITSAPRAKPSVLGCSSQRSRISGVWRDHSTTAASANSRSEPARAQASQGVSNHQTLTPCTSTAHKSAIAGATSKKVTKSSRSNTCTCIPTGSLKSITAARQHKASPASKAYSDGQGETSTSQGDSTQASGTAIDDRLMPTMKAENTFWRGRTWIM